MSDSDFAFPGSDEADSLPSETILGSHGCRGGSGADDDDAAGGGRRDLACRPGLSRGRRSVRGCRALGGEAGVVASVLADDDVVLLDANARRQPGGASSGTLRDLGRRGGHPRLEICIFERMNFIYRWSREFH